MARFIVSRLFGLAGVLLAVSAITFGLMHAVPGGPFDAQAMDRQQMIPEEIKQQLNAKFGLDKPVWEQYLVFLGNAVRLDFGYSFSNSTRTVVQIFREQWPYSMQLGILTLAFSMVVGLGLGILAALRQNSWIDHTGTLVSIFCLVMPSFVFAVLLQFVLSVRLGWLPTGGWGSPKQWIMPVLANSLGPIVILQRFTRSSMADVIRANYVRTARAKGLTERRTMLVHVLKNALTPVVTVGGPMIAGLITGSFFVESIFRIPGIGLYFVTAIQQRDYPMIMATTLVWTALISVTYLLTDLVYAALDPRVSVIKAQ
jgi:ABC-type dipeptide/oligopeptide/nickel transport system permease component